MIKMYRRGNQRKIGKYNVDMINAAHNSISDLMDKGWHKTVADAYAPTEMPEAMPEPTPVSVDEEVEPEVEMPTPKAKKKKGK